MACWILMQDQNTRMIILTLFLFVFSKVYSQTQNVSMSSVQIANETTTSMNCSDPSNNLNLQCINNSLKGQSSLIQLILVATVSGIWILYLTFYNSRFVGLLITKVANKVWKGKFFQFKKQTINNSSLCMIPWFQKLVY